MMRNLWACILIIAGQVVIRAEDHARPIQAWVEALSVKTDHRCAHFHSVQTEIRELPLESQCEVLRTMAETGSAKNIRFQIRLRYLWASLVNIGAPCSDEMTTHSHLKEALQKAYEIEDDFLIAELNDYLCWHFTIRNDYSNAVLHGLIAREVQHNTGLENYQSPTISRSRLGTALYHMHDYPMCIVVLKEALEGGPAVYHPGADTLDILNQKYAWNTLGLSYLKLHNWDSAFIAFDQALKINQEYGDDFWYGLIHGNIGDIFFDKGEYDSAEAHLRIDIEQSIAAEQWDNAANSMQRLAQILLRDDPRDALKMLHEASGYLDRMPNPVFTENLAYAYTQVFTALNDADSVNAYMQEYLAAKAVLDKAVYESRSRLLQGQLAYQQNVHQVRTLNKQKQRILIIRNFTIVIAFVLGVAGYFYIQRQRMKMRLKQEQALRERQQAKREAQSARQQLQLFTEHLMEKTLLVQKLERELSNRENRQHQSLEKDLVQHPILTEDDWEKFKELFESVHSGFFDNLRQIAPDITVSELRMAALLKLQVPARKSASLLGISPNSVYKTRQRLRHRIGLGTDADLLRFFETN